MRKMLLAAFLLSATTAQAKGKIEAFTATYETAWTATLAVIAEEFTLSSADQNSGVISFRAGTQDASVLLVKTSDTVTTLTVNSKAVRAGLSIGFGADARKVQNKLLNKVRARLAPAKP